MKKIYKLSRSSGIKKMLLIMKLATLFLFIGFMQVSAGVYSQRTNMSLTLKNASIEQLIDAIRKESGYKFVYRADLFKESNTLDLNAKNKAIDEVLNEVLVANGFEYEMYDDIIIVRKGAPKQIIEENVLEQNNVLEQDEKKIIIRGTIKDEKGERLPHVAIRLKGTTYGCVSGVDGTYELKAPDEKGLVLEVSRIGYETLQIPVEGRTNIDVVIVEDIKGLDEVVVTGYQTISRERSTGSYATVSSKQLESKVQTNILERIEGSVSGLSLYKGKPVIRGTSTLYAVKDPLIVVDGVPYEGELAAINPNEISNITVLKDATAASIYGARSANGVIVVTTKGGNIGKPKFSYTSTLQLTALPDRSYQNLMSSSEFIDYQMYIFDKTYNKNVKPNSKLALNDVNRLLYAKANGSIEESFFNSEINRLKGLDRYDQVVDELMNKTKLTQQHNLSLKGGSEIHQYAVSLNFLSNGSYEKDRPVDRIGINVKNNFKLADWANLDLGVIGSVNSYDYNSGISGTSLIGSQIVPYQMLRDENGNPAEWEYIKSLTEVDRLNSLGLVDESYIPLEELSTRRQTFENRYVNLNIGAKFDITSDLNFELRGQTELGNSYSKDYSTKDNYLVRKMVNDATQIEDGVIINNIPNGGQITERYGDQKSYTLRAQLNYAKLFGEKHDVKVLLGTERRKSTNFTGGHLKYGYDDTNLSFSSVDEASLANYISGTQSTNGLFRLSQTQPTYVSVDDRYVSFYGNGSYMFDGKLGFNASIRMDQSNLFGTDPKYQYRPLWSLGGSYKIDAESSSWLDNLKIRATYGINGNVYKQSGPYIISRIASSGNYLTGEKYSEIVSPPNASLRWEKTNTTNIGLDYSLFSNRISGSIDLYNKNTTDLLGQVEADPTQGWANVVRNYASMNNKGIEFQIYTQNIVTKDFKWGTNFLFSYNKNEITKLNTAGVDAYSYISSLQAREGKPFNSLYSIRYAGLDATGSPTAYAANDSIITSLGALTPEDLVYSGTYDPPYHLSLTNDIKFKQWELSFLVIFYGGNVMRDVAAGFYPTYSAPSSLNANLDRVNLNYWKQPGDEANIYTSPAYKKTNDNTTSLWRYADIHVQKADYAKLRNISLAYNLPKSILEKINISSLKLFFDAQNLARWSANRHNLDPEVWSNENSRGIAIMPTYTFGINLNF